MFYSNDTSYISYGLIKDIGEKHIIHSCSTEYGASGSPVCLLSSRKVIGIHVGGLDWGANKSISLYYGISEFLNFLNKNKIIQESIGVLPIQPAKNYNYLNNNEYKKLNKRHNSDNKIEKKNNLKNGFKDHKIENEKSDEISCNIIFNNTKTINNSRSNKAKNNYPLFSVIYHQTKNKN